MLSKLFHAWKLRRLQAQKQRSDRRFETLLKRAEAAKEATDDILWEWSRDTLWYDDKILELNSNFLRSEAERLIVPYPDWRTERDQYEQSEISEKWRLTQSAQAALRKTIRQERKEWAEQVLMWLPLLSALVALLSLLVTALAILTRH